MNALDLFCGCGGISVGLKQAGFSVAAGVDNTKQYIQTFNHNFSGKGHLLDLADTPPSEFLKIIGYSRDDIHLVCGGPPCQGFSKNVPRSQRTLESDNNLLIRTFLAYCEHIRPLAILMENVAEMKNGFEQSYTQEIEERLKAAGYVVKHSVLNAADYGVPQRRRRAFFVATRCGKVVLPSPTHEKSPQDGALFPRPQYVNVWDAIGDLPNLKHGEGTEPCNYATAPFSEFQKSVRKESNRVFNHVARKLKPLQHRRLSSLKPGQGIRDLPDEIRPKGGYSGAYGRLTKEMVAPTITRWVFHPGSGRWGHPEDIRTLTMREAARIQAFPDSYKFVGSFNQQAGQIGNAVPPLLARRIAEQIKKVLV